MVGGLARLLSLPATWPALGSDGISGVRFSNIEAVERDDRAHADHESRAAVSGRRLCYAGRRPRLCRPAARRVSISSRRAASSRRPCPIANCAQRAVDLAGRLAGCGAERGDRVAIVAETSPDFVTVFFACQYAGLVPVPLPLCINIGGHDAYVERLRGMLVAAGARIAVAPADLLATLRRGRATRPRSTRVATAAEIATWPAVRGAGGAVRPGRALLHPVLVRQHQLPARRAGHPARDRRQCPRDRDPRAGAARRRPLHLLAAALSRHGAGRLLPDAGDGAGHASTICRARRSPAARCCG